MKRFLGAALAALALFLTAHPVGATTLRTKDVGWLYSRASRDTILAYFPSAGPGNFQVQVKRDLQSLPETTATFSLVQGGGSGFALVAPPFALVSTASKDTAVVGWLRIFTDSSGTAVTNTLSTISYVLEGSSDGGTWAAIFTHASNACVASGDQAFIPITLWYNASLSPGTTGGKPSPLIAYPMLRFRITAATGNFFAARCQLVYWGAD